MLVKYGAVEMSSVLFFFFFFFFFFLLLLSILLAGWAGIGENQYVRFSVTADCDVPSLRADLRY